MYVSENFIHLIRFIHLIKKGDTMQPERAVYPSDECRLAIGDFCCLLVCRDAAYAQFFRKYYAGFLVDERTPDLIIEIDVVQHPPRRYQLPSSLLMAKQVNGNSFDLGSGLLKGTLHLSQQLCKITVKQILLRFIRVFEQFLYQVYYTLLYSRNPNPTSFLIHASGVIRNNGGFIFTGRSGSGKSTIASLSCQEATMNTVLNDEIVLIEKRGDDFWVRSTPFNGYFKDKENGCAPLKAVFLLEQAKENYLKPLSKADFVRQFIKEIIFPAPLLSMDREAAASRNLDFCAQLVETVSLYQLGFTLDGGFWKCIDEEKELWQYS